MRSERTDGKQRPLVKSKPFDSDELDKLRPLLTGLEQETKPAKATEQSPSCFSFQDCLQACFFWLKPKPKVSELPTAPPSLSRSESSTPSPSLATVFGQGKFPAATPGSKLKLNTSRAAQLPDLPEPLSVARKAKLVEGASSKQASVELEKNSRPGWRRAHVCAFTYSYQPTPAQFFKQLLEKPLPWNKQGAKHQHQNGCCSARAVKGKKGFVPR